MDSRARGSDSLHAAAEIAGADDIQGIKPALLKRVRTFMGLLSDPATDLWAPKQARPSRTAS